MSPDDRVMPFGKHKGRTLGDIGGDDEGLRYLDWLAGRDFVKGGPLEVHLKAYLSQDVIARELDRILGN